MLQIQNIQQKLYKFFKDLEFEEERHIYRVNGKILPSTSHKIKKYYTAFDEIGKAKKVAKKRNTSVNQILNEWRSKGKKAAEHGTEVHLYAEVGYWNGEKPKNKQEEAVKKFLDYIQESDKYEIVWKELKMYHKDFWYAGTTDLVLLNKELNSLEPFDYKTNEDLDKYYENLLYPFQYMTACNHNKYQIQLSFYQLLLEQVSNILEMSITNRCIVWLKRDGTYELRNTNDFTELLLNDLKNDN